MVVKKGKSEIKKSPSEICARVEKMSFEFNFANVDVFSAESVVVVPGAVAARERMDALRADAMCANAREESKSDSFEESMTVAEEMPAERVSVEEPPVESAVVEDPSVLSVEVEPEIPAAVEESEIPAAVEESAVEITVVEDAAEEEEDAASDADGGSESDEDEDAESETSEKQEEYQVDFGDSDDEVEVLFVAKGRGAAAGGRAAVDEEDILEEKIKAKLAEKEKRVKIEAMKELYTKKLDEIPAGKLYLYRRYGARKNNMYVKIGSPYDEYQTKLQKAKNERSKAKRRAEAAKRRAEEVADVESDCEPSPKRRRTSLDADALKQHKKRLDEVSKAQKAQHDALMSALKAVTAAANKASEAAHRAADAATMEDRELNGADILAMLKERKNFLEVMNGHGENGVLDGSRRIALDDFKSPLAELMMNVVHTVACEPNQEKRLHMSNTMMSVFYGALENLAEVENDAAMPKELTDAMVDLYGQTVEMWEGMETAQPEPEEGKEEEKVKLPEWANATPEYIAPTVVHAKGLMCKARKGGKDLMRLYPWNKPATKAGVEDDTSSESAAESTEATAEAAMETEEA